MPTTADMSKYEGYTFSVQATKKEGECSLTDPNDERNKTVSLALGYEIAHDWMSRATKRKTTEGDRSVEPGTLSEFRAAITATADETELTEASQCLCNAVFTCFQMTPSFSRVL